MIIRVILFLIGFFLLLVSASASLTYVLPNSLISSLIISFIIGFVGTIFLLRIFDE